MSSFERKVALRYLWSRRKEAFVTIITVVSILGVALSGAVLCLTLSIMTGFEQVLKEKLVGVNSHILVRPFYGELKESERIRQSLLEDDQVSAVDPYTQNQVLLQFQQRATGVLVKGISRESVSAQQLAAFLPTAEDLPLLFDPPPVTVDLPDGGVDQARLPGLVIGRSLALSMGARPGDAVTLLSPVMGSTPFGLVPRSKRFVVTGIYHSGLSEYESGLVYADIEEAQSFFKLNDAVAGLEVRVANLDDAPAVATRLRNRLSAPQNFLSVMDWTESNRALWEALKLEKKVYFLVLTLLTILASFSIVTTLVLVVLEKRRDIAVFRTLGASSRSVARIFVMMGSFIGLVGTFLGLTGGYLGGLALREYGFELNNEIFPVSTVPVVMEFENFLLVGICSVLICFLATLYPAFRAARLDPCQVLRYE